MIKISLKQKKSSNDGGLETQTNTQKFETQVGYKPIIHIVSIPHKNVFFFGPLGGRARLTLVKKINPEFARDNLF